MMTAREQAEQLRQQAIQTLLEEKEAIDEMLKTLGYGEHAAGVKRRGRRPKQQEVQQISSSVEEQNNLPSVEEKDSATSQPYLGK